MSAINVTLTAGTLPVGYCFTTLQQYYDDIIALTLAQLPGTSNLFNFGPNMPDPADQDKPWVRTTVAGAYDRLYTYDGGYGMWVSPHPTPYGDNERRMWVGTEVQLWSYDSGDGTDPATATDVTGSFWAIDTSFQLKFPYGADAATVNPTDTGGAATSSALPAHTHDVTVYEDGWNVDDFETGTGGILTSKSLTHSTKAWATTSASAGGGVIDTIPPYYAVHFIKRSARKYYTVT